MQNSDKKIPYELMSVKQEHIKEEIEFEDNNPALCDSQTSISNAIIKNEQFLNKYEYSLCSFKRESPDEDITIKLEPLECDTMSFECLGGIQIIDHNSSQKHLVEHALATTQDDTSVSKKYLSNNHKNATEFEMKQRNQTKSHISHSGQLESSILSCEFCDHKTTLKSSLKRHMLIHLHDSKKYVCNYCEYESIRKGDLVKHMLRHGPKKLSCIHCDYKTVWKSCLKSHILCHQPDDQKLKCNFCDYRTIRKSNLKNHMLCHQPDGKKFRCSSCDFKTIRECTLKLHMSRHEPDGKKFSCDYCDYKCRTKDRLKSHMLYHQSDDKKLSCDYCEYKTVWQSNLKKHMLHHLPKRFNCHYCGFKTGWENGLKRHMLGHEFDCKNFN